MYLDGNRATLVERTSQLERFVFVSDAATVRGSQGMYPLPPPVEPVEIDRETFDEAWAAGA